MSHYWFGDHNSAPGKDKDGREINLTFHVGMIFNDKRDLGFLRYNPDCRLKGCHFNFSPDHPDASLAADLIKGMSLKDALAADDARKSAKPKA